MTTKPLETKIENIRCKLLQTAKEHGLSSNETIQLSTELDYLLNLYSEEKNDTPTNFHEKEFI